MKEKQGCSTMLVYSGLNNTVCIQLRKFLKKMLEYLFRVNSLSNPKTLCRIGNKTLLVVDYLFVINI